MGGHPSSRSDMDKCVGCVLWKNRLFLSRQFYSRLLFMVWCPKAGLLEHVLTDCYEDLLSGNEIGEALTSVTLLKGIQFHPNSKEAARLERLNLSSYSTAQKS